MELVFHGCTQMCQKFSDNCDICVPILVSLFEALLNRNGKAQRGRLDCVGEIWAWEVSTSITLTFLVCSDLSLDWTIPLSGMAS